MLALVKERRAPGAVLKDVDVPEPGPYEVLAKVRATSICGTDAHIYFWNKWAASVSTPPKIMGHEFAAQIVQVGKSVVHLKKGDMISGETHIYCGTCVQCLAGNRHLCENMRLRGVDTDGCFAEYVVVSSNTAWKNDPSIPPIVASVQEPLGNAVHSVFSGEVTGRSILVLGCGPIGLCAIELCKSAGAAKVIAVDISEYRLNMADKMGADVVINGEKENTRQRVSEILPHGADVVLEMSGSGKALNDGLKVVKHGGRVTLLGLPAGRVSLDLSNDVITKGITLQGIFGRKIFSTWELASRLMKNRSVNLNKIITHRLHLKDYKKAFELISEGKCGKIVMTV